MGRVCVVDDKEILRESVAETLLPVRQVHGRFRGPVYRPAFTTLRRIMSSASRERAEGEFR